MERMFIYTKTQFLEEMQLNAIQRYAQPNRAGMEQFVLNMKTVVPGSVTAHPDLQALCVNDLSAQQIHANLVVLAQEAKQDLDSYVCVLSEEEELFVKMVSRK